MHIWSTVRPCNVIAHIAVRRLAGTRACVSNTHNGNIHMMIFFWRHCPTEIHALCSSLMLYQVDPFEDGGHCPAQRALLTLPPICGDCVLLRFFVCSKEQNPRPLDRKLCSLSHMHNSIIAYDGMNETVYHVTHNLCRIQQDVIHDPCRNCLLISANPYSRQNMACVYVCDHPKWLSKLHIQSQNVWHWVPHCFYWLVRIMLKHFWKQVSCLSSKLKSIGI